MRDFYKTRRIAYALIVAGLLCPLLLFGVQPKWVGPAIIIGLALISGAISMLHRISLESLRDDIAFTGGRSQQSDSGRTIYVSMVDENGRALPADQARQRLDDAHASASPRDTVIPVYKSKGNLP